MKRDDRKIWFHAKTYGYGWGLPASWQGWLVYVGYVVLLVTGWYGFGYRAAYWFFGYALLLTALLLGICLLKGEKPAWRWGRKDDK